MSSQFEAAIERTCLGLENLTHFSVSLLARRPSRRGRHSLFSYLPIELTAH